MPRSSGVEGLVSASTDSTGSVVLAVAVSDKMVPSASCTVVVPSTFFTRCPSSPSIVSCPVCSVISISRSNSDHGFIRHDIEQRVDLATRFNHTTRTAANQRLCSQPVSGCLRARIGTDYRQGQQIVTIPDYRRARLGGCNVLLGRPASRSLQ